MPGAAITWFGHACVLFELDGARLLTDPLLRRRAADPPLSIPRSEELADLDVVLISRVHYDHLDLPSLDLLPRQTPLVTPRGVGPLLREHGFLDVTELVAGEALEVNGVGVRAMHAEDRPRHGPIAASAPSLGFLLGGTETIYFAGATGVYRRSPEPGRRLDVAVLPVAGEARQPPPRHLEPDSAVDALRVLRPRFAVPIQWRTFRPLHADTPAPRTPDPREHFARRARELAPDVDVALLAPGERWAVGAAHAGFTPTGR